MKSFKARVKVDGIGNEVVIQASDFGSAKRLIEAQYGKNSILSGPTEVK